MHDFNPENKHLGGILFSFLYDWITKSAVHVALMGTAQEFIRHRPVVMLTSIAHQTPLVFKQLKKIDFTERFTGCAVHIGGHVGAQSLLDAEGPASPPANM